MLKSCKYCGGIHDESFICPQKPERKPFYRKPYKKSDKKIDYSKYRKNTDAYFFRNTKAWQMKRKEIRERDLNCCRVHFNKGKVICFGLSVHHIVPIEKDWDKRLDDDNLITLCDECHKLAETGKLKKAFLKKLADTPPTVEELNGCPNTHKLR